MDMNNAALNEPSANPQIPTSTNSPNYPINSSSSSANTYYKYAGFGTRLAATVVDGIIILALILPTELLIRSLTGQSFFFKGISSFSTLTGVIFLIYEIAFLYLYSATIGKKLFKIKVVSTHYQKLSFVQVLLRQTIGQSISGMISNLGYLWIIIDDKKTRMA